MIKHNMVEDLIFGTYNKLKSFNDNIFEWQNENGIILQNENVKVNDFKVEYLKHYFNASSSTPGYLTFTRFVYPESNELKKVNITKLGVLSEISNHTSI